MTREEFEVKYAKKYMSYQYNINSGSAVDAVISLRDAEGYYDLHIDLCWKVQKAKEIFRFQDLESYVKGLEW